MPKRAFIENAVHALEISDIAKTGVAGVPTRIVSPSLDTVESVNLFFFREHRICCDELLPLHTSCHSRCFYLGVS